MVECGTAAWLLQTPLGRHFSVASMLAGPQQATGLMDELDRTTLFQWAKFDLRFDAAHLGIIKFEEKVAPGNHL